MLGTEILISPKLSHPKVQIFQDIVCLGRHFLVKHMVLQTQRPFLDRFATENLSRVTRKPAFCICKNKDPDQLRGNCEADQRLCFRYADSTIPLLPTSEMSSLQPSSVTVQPGLCGTRSETPKTSFLTMRLIYNQGEVSHVADEFY